MRKLKSTETKPTRERMWQEQNGNCAMCHQPLPITEAVLDHNHVSGAVRGVCHRSCNSLEGKIVNAVKRFGVKDLSAFLKGLVDYHQLHETDQTGLMYCTHKTPEEKKIAATKKRKLKALEKKKT